jgi:hypothetical protein
MNIICLYWIGNFRKRRFVPQDVWNLYQSVEKHSDRPFNFYCLTNDMKADLPGTKIQLLYNWPGWWSKMELFRPDLPCGRTLYMDLDSRVVSSLQPIFDYGGDLVMFNTRMNKANEQRIHGVVCRYQAATMLFTPCSPVMRETWDRFRLDPNKYMQEFRGEQDMYGRWIPDQPTFPDNWMIKLDTLKRVKLPKEVIIVTGQGDDYDFRWPHFAMWINELSRKKVKA